jgi:membrane-bound lytic murein transglycosylase A
MKLIFLFVIFITLFTSCSQKELFYLQNHPKTALEATTFDALNGFEKDDFSVVLKTFQKNCQSTKAEKIYGELCKKAIEAENAKAFILENFRPYIILNKEKNTKGLLTGYYEASIHASYKKSEKYPYPIYATPKDLVVVDLSAIYPELKSYRLRGRVVNGRVIPYYTRAQAQQQDLNATVLCYCDSKIDKFFLEVQGSGIAKFDDNSSIYLGYDNQNGHKYRSIGKYLIESGILKKEDVSLESIKKWLQENPQKADEVLNYNNSLVFFSKREHGATGALGLELIPMRSVAVDRRYIPLGSMLYLNADYPEGSLKRIVFAQDTGGAIKGRVRADLFTGSGEKALKLAGSLKAPLQLWILLPKNINITKEENE